MYIIYVLFTIDQCSNEIRVEKFAENFNQYNELLHTHILPFVNNYRKSRVYFQKCFINKTAL